MSWLSASFVGKHWRGEYSLAVSYFVFGFVVTLAAKLTVFVLSNLVSRGYEPTFNLVAVLSFWAGTLSIGLWQIVGIWRSATNHPARGGRILFARLAKVAAILLVLMTAHSLIRNAWPQLRESFRIVLGDPGIGTFSIRLLGDGTAVELSGGITFEAVEELERVLGAVAEVRAVVLESRGGRLGPARRLRATISARGLSTYVHSHCFSACVIAFAGGRQRYLHATARLGFHGSSFPGVPAWASRGANLEVVEEIVSSGVDRGFAERAFLSDGRDLWFPSVDELVRSGFVTHVGMPPEPRG